MGVAREGTTSAWDTGHVQGRKIPNHFQAYMWHDHPYPSMVFPRSLSACMLVCLLLVPAIPASEPEPGSVWTVHTTVEATVTDGHAIVDVIAQIENRGPDPEFPFQVRVPDGAFVSGLSIERDGDLYEARIADRDEARAEYEEHKESEMTAGLVEKKRGTQTYAFLVNVAEQESVTATLRYEQYLAAHDGVYDLALETPVSGFGEDRGAAFDVTIHHSDGVTDAWGSAGSAEEDEGTWHLAHEVGPRPDDAATPFSAHYTLPATDDGGSVIATPQNGTGYFAHRFRAPAEAEDMPVDLALVLDTSGSMNGLKIEQLQDAARQVVGALESTDRLQIVTFSSEAEAAWPALRSADAATKQEARDHIDALFAGGGTNIEDGLRTGFAAFPEDPDPVDATPRLALQVLLSDGQATAGETNTDRLRAIAVEENRGDVRVFALAFGAGADWGLTAGLAQDGDGMAMHVPAGEGAEVDLRRFMTALTAPVLRDVEVQYDQDVEATSRSADVLFAGGEMLIVGTFDAGVERLSGTVTATTPSGPRVYGFDEAVAADGAHTFLPRLVAAHQVQAWQEAMDADGEDDATVAQIKETALRFGFVTDHTSLVLTLPEGEPPVRELEEENSDGADAADSAGTAADSSSDGASRGSGDGADGTGDGSTGGDDQEGEDQDAPGFTIVLVVAALLVAARVRRR